MTTLHPFAQILGDRFGGILYAGKHDPDSKACVLEVASVVRGETWTDNPSVTGLPDLRPLNDARWSSDAARTQALLPVVIALWEWPQWSEKKKTAWTQHIAKRIIQEILPSVLWQAGLNVEANRCEKEGTEEAAWAAARAAEAAAWAAARAAEAAAASGEDVVLQLACRIWIEEAQRDA